MLFDDVARTETRPARHAEPHYPYLNATARPEATAFLSRVLMTTRSNWHRPFTR
jgi:hypothetical protein